MSSSRPGALATLLTAAVGATSLGVVAYTATPARLTSETTAFVLIAVIGYLIGVLIARGVVHDALGHLLSLVAAVFVPFLVLQQASISDAVRSGSASTFWTENRERFEGAISAFQGGQRFDDDVAALLLGFATFLIAYSSAWLLFRQNLLVASVSIPAGILLMLLAFDSDKPSWPALVYLALCFVLAAQSASLSRARRWSLRGFTAPTGLWRWSLLIGAGFAVAALLASSVAPLRAPDQTVDWAAAQSDRVSGFLQSQSDLLGDNPSDKLTDGNYGDFGESFEIGSGIPTGDSPVALVQGLKPPYLSARKFDSYTGRGWASNFDAAIDIDDAGDPPRIAFSANQPMNLDQDLLTNRLEVIGRITTFSEGTGPLLTVESFYSASLPTTIRVGWQAIDLTIPVASTEMRDVPLDLRGLVGLLKLANYQFGEDGIVVFSGEDLAEAVQSEQDSLRQHYPVETTITVDEAGSLVLTATGRLPIYDDIEAVFYGGMGTIPSTYSVTAAIPSVSPATLATASTDYPAGFDRYIELPETVTQRTDDLALAVVRDAGATNPYDAAIAIQTYLRANYDYLLEAGPGPDGVDVVDYFLFESQIGRCDHFASSMVVMLRSLGIPSRIVAGLASGDYDATEDGYVFRGKDAHSWVEAYFPGYGWITFEPTPSETPSGVSETDNLEQQPLTPEPTPTINAAAVVTPTPAPAESTPVAAPVVNQEPSGTSGSATRWLLILPLLVGIIGLIAAVPFAWNWRLRGLSPASGYFVRFTRLGRFLGVSYDGAMTPAEYAQQVSSARPRLADPAQTITDAYSAERYGPQGNDIDESRLAKSWAAMRAQMLRIRLRTGTGPSTGEP